MKSRKKMIVSILCLFLCVLVTYAWINELQNQAGRYLRLELNKASAADSEIKVQLYKDIGDDVFEDITKLYISGQEENLESFDNFAPGCRQKFRVDITNLTDASVNLRLILTEIICDNQELKDCVIIGTNGFDGFTADYPEPTVQNKVLSDGMDASSSFVLVDHVEIPPDNEEKPVSIYFYVMFTAAGTEALENQSFSIGAINFLTL